MAAPEPLPPPEPSPRQLLVAAQLLASGEPPALAAVQAGLRPARLAALRDTPEFEALLDDCRALEALPQAEQDAPRAS
jgi:hypothetical protein